jgi:hypothetical protein
MGGFPADGVLEVATIADPTAAESNGGGGGRGRGVLSGAGVGVWPLGFAQGDPEATSARNRG